MPHMIGYLGGDQNTLVARRAKENDIRLAVEFPDERNMLVVCVMQTGEILMSWTDTSVHQSGRADAMYHVGTLVERDGAHVLETDATDIRTNAPVYFLPHKPPAD